MSLTPFSPFSKLTILSIALTAASPTGTHVIVQVPMARVEAVHTDCKRIKEARAAEMTPVTDPAQKNKNRSKPDRKYYGQRPPYGDINAKVNYVIKLGQ